MPLRLFDERTGKLRQLEVRLRMSVYVCGITPYDSAHVGHAFTYAHFDVLVRYLRHLGAAVEHVQNVTDVDDDILRTARERGVDYRELAERETAEFDRDMLAIGNVAPTISPRATAFVPDMVAEVDALVRRGHAYERDGTVYFRVASDPGYGQLSGYDRPTMLRLAAERGGFPDDPNKDDPLDFVLWQRSKPDEPWWESPWGRGRPGWHIECSTMARTLLGGALDVHGGGSDLIYPHHESEQAQTAGAHPDDPEPFVRHWMHAGMVGYQGDKMSKSLGNLVFVRDLVARFDPVAVRRALLRHHYRQDWTFNEDEVPEAAPRTGAAVDAGSGPEAFFAALDDDLDVPRALAVLDGASSSEDPATRSWVAAGRRILGL